VATRINYIDMAGAEMLVQEAKRLQQNGGGLYFVGLKPELWQFLAEGGFLKKIGAQHFFDNKADAIAAIYSHVEKSICSNCTKKVFVECGAQRQGTIAPRSPAANEAPEVSAVMP
jgi:SulP family sulfate permease